MKKERLCLSFFYMVQTMKRILFFLLLILLISFSFLGCSNSDSTSAEKTVRTFVSVIKENDLTKIKKVAPFFNDFSEEEQTLLVEGFSSFFTTNYTVKTITGIGNDYKVTIDVPQSDGGIMSLTFPCQKQKDKSWIILSDITTTVSYSTFEIEEPN